MTKTARWAIFLVAFTTLLTSIGQVFFKFGANKIDFSNLFFTLVTNYFLFIGLFIYVIAAVLVVISLKYGELSILYPIISLSYVWVSFLSIYFFYEIMSITKWFGIIAILFGVSFIGVGSK